MWLIIVALIMAFSETRLYLGHTSAQAGCLFREERSNCHYSEMCFSVLLADTIPTNDSVRATGTISIGLMGEGLVHGRKWAVVLPLFQTFGKQAPKAHALFWGTELYFPVSGLWIVTS